MLQKKKSERGQALVLIVFAIMGMLALAGLALDGGQTFSDRRQGQNAADAAALAAALTYQDENHSLTNVSTKAQAAAAANGYTNDGIRSVVTVSAPTATAPGDCPGDETEGLEFTVTITSTLQTWFAPIIGVKEVENTTTATARACNLYYQPLFDGNAVVGLKPSGDSIYINGDANWKVKGGGVYANQNFNGKCGKPFVLDTTEAVSAVGTADCVPIGTAKVTGLPQIPYPTSPFTDTSNPIIARMPPAPACDGTEDGGYVVPNSPSSFTFTNGVYCVNNFDAFDKEDIVLDNAVLYIKDTIFGVKFAGGGGFAGKGRQTGPYAGYFMVIAFATPGQQEIEWRGNSSTDGIYGTIFAPSTTIDYRGNSYGKSDHSQLIAYEVQTLGTADIVVDYKAEENRQYAAPPTIQLVK